MRLNGIEDSRVRSLTSPRRLAYDLLRRVETDDSYINLLLPSLLASRHFLMLRILLPFGSLHTVLPSPGIPPLSTNDMNSNSFFVVFLTRVPSPVSMPLAILLAKSNISDAEIPKQLAPVLSVNWFAAGVPGGHLNFPFSSTSIPNALAALAMSDLPLCPIVFPGSRFSL